jgi:hypothetical protein
MLPRISWDKVQLLRSRYRQGMLQPSGCESAPDLGIPSS